MTMVLAMIPAVSATDETGGSTSTSTSKTPDGSKANPYVLYVGDSMKETAFLDFKCETHTSATKSTTCTIVDSDDRTMTSSGNYYYSGSSNAVSYNSSTGYITANSTTLTKVNSVVENTRAKFTMKCSGSTSNVACTKTETKYYLVYAKPSKITLSQLNSTSLSTISSALTIYGEKKIYYKLDTDMYDQNFEITVDADTSIIKEVKKENFGEDSYGKYFTIEPTGLSGDTDLTVYFAKGETKHQVSTTIRVTYSSAAVLTLSYDNKEYASSTDTDKELKTINAEYGDKITIKASFDSALGAAADIKWRVTEDEAGTKPTSVLSLPTTNTTSNNASKEIKVTGVGEAYIIAMLGSAKAKIKVSSLNDISSITLTEDNISTEYNADNANELKTKELAIGETLNVNVLVKDFSYQETAAKYTVWSITNPSSSNKVLSVYSGDVNPNDGTFTGATATFKANKAGTATVTATLGGKSKSFTVTVKETGTNVVVSSILTPDFYPEVRNGNEEEIRAQLNADAKYQYALVKGKPGRSDTEQTYSVPITWTSASPTDKVAYGSLSLSDGNNTYTYSDGVKPTVKAHLTLTDKPAVTNITITASKDIAVENDKVTLTASATAAPSGSTLSYQWYVNGTAISKATSKSVTYTIPKSSVDSSTAYKFTCEVTAENKGESTTVTSSAYTVTVSRDYSISLAASNGKTSFHVGDDITMKATLYYKGTAVTNTSFSWQLLNSSENSLDSAIATIAGNGSSATITSKAADSADGSKITVRATVSYNGYSYSSSETITLYPAEAATFKQSVGSGATIKASSITSAVSSASGQTPSYVVFSSASGCTLTTSSTSSSSVGSTKCYVSASSGQSLSSVYVKPSSTTGSVKYTAYNAGGYAIATGSVSFDSEESNQTVYGSGASFKASGAADQILEAYPSAAYVKFELPSASTGHLFYGFNTIADFSAEVSASEKYYFDASSSQNDVEDVYFLPTYGVTGTVKISYTAYSSSNSDLGDGTISLSIQKKTASSKFTDVTYNNTGYWAADSIDFMADNGLFNGTSTYNFSPNASMTRAMLVTVLYRAAGEPSVSGVTNPFTDIKKDYYYNAVLWAYKNNIVTGTSANKFSPDANVTREQIASILYRYMDSPTATGSLVGYTDRTKISAYAATAMQWAIGEGYITGTTPTSLDPTGNATRAQVAVIMHRFITK